MTQRYAFWFSQPAPDNRLKLCLFSVTLQLITMVGGVGVEPTHPEGTVLQTAATLRLRRPPILNWQAPKDLNPDQVGWSHTCYRYTRGLCTAVDRPHLFNERTSLSSCKYLFHTRTKVRSTP